MAYHKKCKTCIYSNCGEKDSLSDYCDECTCDGDTGWFGFTDCSIVDDNGHSPHFNSDEEHRKFLNDLKRGVYGPFH